MPATPAVTPAITVVGIGADGWASVPTSLQETVVRAEVLLGAPRTLDLLQPVPGQVREPWPSPLRDGLPDLLEKYAGRRVVALATGDPMVSGIGTTLVEVLGADRVVVHPNVSSVALARARMGWSAESSVVVSLVGRDPHLVLAQVAPGRRILVLSADEITPGTVAGLLTATGHGTSHMTVLGDLGAPEESRTSATAATWDATVSRLNVVAVEVEGRGRSWVPGLPDDAFEHDGQLTKRDLRASALARLCPQPGALLWDVGAGAGSIGIEWLRSDPTCRAVAVEADPERAARIGRNAAALGVPTLEVVTGRAPAALADLAAPDAVFVGGGATRAGVVESCLAALRPGGRLVVHGVTLETEHLLGRLYADHGGELVRIQVETAAPIGTFTGWTPARAVTQWALTR